MILLTHWKGRFGNRMFTYLYGLNYARRLKTQFYLPSKWEGTTLFADRGARVYPDEELCKKLVESGRNRTEAEVRHNAVFEHFGIRKIEIAYHDPDKDHYDAHLPEHVFFEKLCVQNSKIFERYSLNEIYSIFEWSPRVKRSQIFQRIADRRESYSVAHLRRGDIANLSLNGKRKTGYSVISRNSYERAFLKFGVDPSEVIWVTDDRTGKFGVSKNPIKPAGWNYPEGSKPVEGCFFDWFEDFLLLCFAKNVFRANSSFSWWAACLNRDGRVFSPVLTERRHYLGPEDEIDVDFVEGNHPHWLNVNRGRPQDSIYIPD